MIAIFVEQRHDGQCRVELRDGRGPSFGVLGMPKYAADELARALGHDREATAKKLTQARADGARHLLAARGWRRAALRLVAMVRGMLGTRDEREYASDFARGMLEPAQAGEEGVWRQLGPRKTEAEQIEAEDEERWTEVLGP